MRNLFTGRKALMCAVLTALLMVLAVGTASATTTKLTTTQNFLDYLVANGIKYTYNGMTESSGESVTVSYTLDNFSSLSCKLFFKESEDEVDLRIWNIVTVSAGKNFALNVVNSLNASWKYCKFVFDESDNTVQAEMDMFINKDHCGEEIFKAMRKLFVVVDTDEIAEQLHSLE